MTQTMMTSTTGLNVLLQGIDVMRRELDKSDLPSQTIVCFLHIAMRGETPMNDLIDLMGVSNASVSRNVSFLGDGSPSDPGLGLVDAFEDPYFRRRKLVRLTPKGTKLVARVLEAINRAASMRGKKQ